MNIYALGYGVIAKIGANSSSFGLIYMDLIYYNISSEFYLNKPKLRFNTYSFYFAKLFGYFDLYALLKSI